MKKIAWFLWCYFVHCKMDRYYSKQFELNAHHCNHCGRTYDYWKDQYSSY